jgi:hypothetical protein
MGGNGAGPKSRSSPYGQAPPTSDAKIDVLTGLVREAAANSGNVTDATWKAAQQAG